MIYIDSSFLLNILFRENNYKDSINIWEKYDHRVSSILLKAESLVTLRRVYSVYQNKLPSNWLSQRENDLKNMFQEVSLRRFDESIMNIIDLKKDLSICRTLDSIHVATALEYKDNFVGTIIICSFDKNMRKLAQKMNISILPDNIDSN